MMMNSRQGNLSENIFSSSRGVVVGRGFGVGSLVVLLRWGVDDDD